MKDKKILPGEKKQKLALFETETEKFKTIESQERYEYHNQRDFSGTFCS